MERFEGNKQLDRYDIKRPFMTRPDRVDSKQIGAWTRLQARVSYKEVASDNLLRSV